MLLRSVTVRVPASTSNLGPGFDCLGLALSLYNELTLELHSDAGPDTITVAGEGAGSLPKDETNLMVRCARLVIGKDKGRLKLKAVNCIPLSRGLGSSAAAILAGLYAANKLFKPALKKEARLLEWACGMEGHPDNAAAAVKGGLVVSVAQDEGPPRLFSLKPHKELAAVVCIPDFELSTALARSVLPKKVSRADAVFNSARALLLGAALEKGQWDRLGLAMEDSLHQDYRAHLVPGLTDVIAAARDLGGCGASLSGAGPTVLALCRAGLRGVAVGREMKRAFARHGVKAKSLVLNPDLKGVRVL